MKRVSKQHAKQASYSIWRYEDQKAILFEKEGGGLWSYTLPKDIEQTANKSK